MSSARTDTRMYEVFLSFRGEDTRASFASHLYASLQNAGIRVFRDDDSLQRGDHISTSLMQAIEGSRISVIVFSTNYAEPRWCLEELVKIMECHTTKGQIGPSQVRRQTGEFGKAFESLLDKISKVEKEEDESLKWRDALREAADLAGFVVLNSRNETKDIKDITEKITHLLDKKDMFIADKPVGVDSRMQDVIQRLDIQQSNGVILLGMWGMGGIGKTTIAKAIYNEIGRKFEGRSFLANVREVWEQPTKQVDLQEQLLSDVFRGTTTKIQSIDSGKIILKDRLCHKRVLIVLDDVNELEQLDALCGSRNWFGSGSRIIITTRNMDILRGNRVDKVYSNKEMDESESSELFNWHAFKQVSPREEFDEISKNVIMYSGGLPLALEVLGRNLYERDVTEWKCVLEKLKTIPNNKVLNKLKISYDGLDDKSQKAIFLDIACFFIGKDRNDVIHILNGCRLFAEDGIRVLVERSLVYIDDDNKLGMHDLLRDMGREIICNDPQKDPEEYSRLWLPEDVDDVLARQTGTKAIEGLTLKLPRDSAKCYSTDAFKKMKKLRLLELAGVQLDGNFEHLSRNLRWLSWNGFPLSCIPTKFYQANLVSIELENSNVKDLWKETQRMEKLKILNLSHCHYLTQTPDFSNLPNLEKLVLTDCPSLSEISPSIGHLNKILLINLEDCIGLCNLPRSIYKLKSLKTLILTGCLKIDNLEDDLEHMESLTTLLANNTAIKRVPPSVLRSKSIGYISLCGYEGFSHDLFPIIQSWMSPTKSFMHPESLDDLSTFSLQSFDSTPCFDSTPSFDSMPSFNCFSESFNAMSYHVSLEKPKSCPDELSPCSESRSFTLSDKLSLDEVYSSLELSSISNQLSGLQSLWIDCRSEFQLSEDAKIILDALHATNSKESVPTTTTSQVSNMTTSTLVQSCSEVHVLGSKHSFNSLLIQMRMNCKLTNILKEIILQNMDVNGSDGRFLPGDSYPKWLTFNSEGSSVTFKVPQVEGRNLMSLLCIVYSSTPDNITSDSLKNVLVINHTKTTIQLYKSEALVSFEDEEGQRLKSSIEPGNKVEVVFVFKNNFIVKKTTVYLVYDEPVSKTTELYHVPDLNAIACSNDENELYHVPDLNAIACSNDENERPVKRFSTEEDPTDDFNRNREKKNRMG